MTEYNTLMVAQQMFSNSRLGVIDTSIQIFELLFSNSSCYMLAYSHFHPLTSSTYIVNIALTFNMVIN